MLKEFREFAVRGNAVDMAVGIIVGAAFGTVVSSLVNDVIMPPIGLLLGGMDFSNLYVQLRSGSPPGPYASLGDAQAAGAVTVRYGLFINAVISLVIVSFVMFLLVRAVTGLKREAPLATTSAEDCPYCLSSIPIKATRCPFCTSELPVDWSHEPK
jgi:large conductance mechanosensitive channel